MCQDYAGVRISDRSAVAIVCDGCSTSPHTDIGARLLARFALRRFDGLDMCEDGKSSGMMAVLREAESATSQLCLPTQCLDATMIIVQSDGLQYSASIYGDGAIAVGYADGSIEVVVVDYRSNAPRYPAYDLDADRSHRYIQMIERENRCMDVEKRQQTIRFDADGHVRIGDIIHPPLTEPVFLSGKVAGGEDRSAVLWIGALTDGIQSFTRPAAVESGRSREAVQAAEALATVFDNFTNLRGKFVERQVSWFLNDCVKNGWRHEDDFTFAAISFAN